MTLFNKFTFIYFEIILQECRDTLDIILYINHGETQNQDDFFECFEKKVFNFLKRQLQVIELIWLAYSVNPANTVVHSIFKCVCKSMGSILSTKLDSLITPLSAPQWTDNALFYLKTLQATLLSNFKEQRIDERKKLIILSDTKALEKSLSAIKNTHGKHPAPTCFISYSWGNQAHVRRIRKMAFDLKAAGIDIILDVEKNKTGSLGPFIGNINSNLKADYILVMCTEDSKEKWEKYLGIQQHKKSTNSTGNVHVLPLEYNQIFRRLYKEQNSRQTVFPILISGTIETSLPEFLPTATDHLNQTECTKYGEQLFQLLKILYQDDSNILLEIDKQEKRYCSQRKENATLMQSNLGGQNHNDLCENNSSLAMKKIFSSTNQKDVSHTTVTEFRDGQYYPQTAECSAQGVQDAEMYIAEERPIACSSSATSSQQQFINSAVEHIKPIDSVAVEIGNSFYLKDQFNIFKKLFKEVSIELNQINTIFEVINDCYEKRDFDSIQPCLPTVTEAYNSYLLELAAQSKEVRPHIQIDECFKLLFEKIQALSADIEEKITSCQHLKKRLDEKKRKRNLHSSEQNTNSKRKTKNRSTGRKGHLTHRPNANCIAHEMSNSNQLNQTRASRRKTKKKHNLFQQNIVIKEIDLLLKSAKPDKNAPEIIEKYFDLKKELVEDTTYRGQKKPPVEGFKPDRDLRLFNFSHSNVKNVVFNGNLLTAANFTSTIGLRSSQLARAHYDFLIITCADEHEDTQNILNSKRAIRGYKIRKKERNRYWKCFFLLTKMTPNHRMQRNDNRENREEQVDTMGKTLHKKT
jgi:SEFIR domain